MSPQMKAILLSFKNLRLKPNVARIVEELDEAEGKLGLNCSDESRRNLSSVRGNLCFASLPEHGNSSFKFDTLSSSMVQSQEQRTRDPFTAQSAKGLDRPQRRSWAVARHILVRSNTVDVLPVQKSDQVYYSSKRCKESLACQCEETEAQVNSAPQSPALERKLNMTFDKRIKPKSELVVNDKVSPAMDQNQSPYGIKTMRIDMKPSSAVVRSKTAGLQKPESAWETLSEERTFLINKWLAREDVVDCGTTRFETTKITSKNKN